MSTEPTAPGIIAATGPESPKSSLDLLSRWHRYRLLLARRWWILFLTVSITVAFQAWNTVSTPPKFVSMGRMMVAGRISLPGSAVYSEEGSNFYGTQIELMQSEAVRLAAQARVQTLRPELPQGGVALFVSQQPRTSIFVFNATGDNAEYTRALLDATMQEYINAKKEMRSAKSDTTLSAITSELKILEKEIKAGDEALVSFLKQNNLNWVRDQTNSAGAYLSSIEGRLASFNTEYERLKRLSVDQNIDRGRAKNPGDAAHPNAGSAADGVMPGYGPGSAYTKAKEDIQLLKAELAEWSKDLRPAHPIIQKLNEKISLQEKLIQIFRDQSATQITDQTESVRIQIENLQAQRKEWSAKALDLSGRAAEYETLKSKLDRSKSLYDHLLTSMQAVDVNKNIDQDVVSVLENASVPMPIKPGLVKAISTALMAGLVGGIVILFLIDLLDDRLISISEFESNFTERVLGRIPRELLTDRAVLNVDDDRHIFAESFSNLRSSLLYLPYDAGRPRTILVTSAVPNEGKSTIASNLAICLAFGGSRTLLIDGDLRRGRFHDLFQVPNDRGFSDVVTQGVPWREVAQKTSIENLTLIPCGKRLAQPSKDLLSPIVAEFIKQIHSEFDFVVFDSCPVLAADDTTTLAPRLDAVVFVVRLGFSRRTASRNALALLYERQVNVLGAILNDVNPSVDGYHYYSYSDYYGSAVNLQKS